MALRVVFFGNSASGYSNHYFQALANAPCRIVGVVDTPAGKGGSTTAGVQQGTTGFSTEARQQSIPVFEPATPNSPDFVAAMRGLSADLFVAVGYMGIFREALLAVPRLIAVNFHASLLPAYRGKHPVFWALRNGERWSGMTLHVVEQGLDTGDILYQVRVRTRRDDTPADLYARILARSAWLPARLMQDAEQDTLRRRPQPAEGASYFSAVGEEDFRLDWSLPAERLRRMIRVSPGQCFSDLERCRLYFMDAEPAPDDGRAQPGTLLTVGRSAGLIQAGGSALRVHRVRIDERAATSLARAGRELGLGAGTVFSSPGQVDSISRAERMSG